MQGLNKFWLLAFIGMWLGFAGVVKAAGPELAMDGLKIVTASAVQMRAAPSTSAPVVNRLRLGVTVRATRRMLLEEQVGNTRGYWYFVSGEGASGWVFGSFLRDFSPDKQESIWIRLAKERSTNKNLKFTDYADTYGFISSVLPKVTNKAAGVELEFNRLLVLQRSLIGITFENAKTQPYKRWLEMRKNEIFFDEISGQWLTPATSFWKLADRVPNSALGDEIAWFASNAPLGGECEGDISCNLSRSLMMEGEYLKRYPNGRFAANSVQQASKVMTFVRQELSNQPNYFRDFPDNSTSKVLQDYLAVVGKSKATGAVQLLEQLRSIDATYRATRR